jgi:hypothetical protein
MSVASSYSKSILLNFGIRLPLMRLSIRRMLALVAVLTVPFAFCGWRLETRVPFPAKLDVATIAVIVGSVAVVADIWIGVCRGRSRLLRPSGWGLLLLSTAVAVWFSSVELDFIVDNCAVCGHGTDIHESRFFSIIPRRVTREFPTVAELIARDLGIPCQHEQTTRWMRNRLFGGCLWGENFVGIHRLGDSPWYPPCARDAVHSWASTDPNFVRNFRERALEGHDRGYLRALVLRLYDACPVDQLPANPYPEYQRAATGSRLSAEGKR